MITIVPDYYGDFVCKAGNCLHSCCKNWEVDIDGETAEKYRSFGTFMDGKADLTPGKEHFLALPDGTCPFLTETGLCRMILEKGEDALCQICRDHPRFRNFHDDHVEMGLGLCCERTGELLFSKQTPVNFVSLTGEDPWGETRKAAFRVKETISKIDRVPEEKLRPETWAELLLPLERLDERWTDLLMKMKEEGPGRKEHDEAFTTASERLKEYLAFRHGKKRTVGFMKFSFCVCIRMAELIAKEGEPEIPDLIEAARLFSSEIEYSTENMERIEAIIGTHGNKK